MSDPGGRPAASVTCALCGTTTDDVPLTWVTEFDTGRGRRFYCDRCSRDNLRAVEARLPQAWW